MVNKVVNLMVPAGRYFIGDVSGFSDPPLFATSVVAGVYYDTEMKYECGVGDYDTEGEYGLFGIIPWSVFVAGTVLTDDDFDFYGLEFSEPSECSSDGTMLRFGSVSFNIAT